MIKVMHVDTVFEVFIFKFFYFGYFFYARRGTYLMMVNFLKTLKPPISGESSTKMSYLGPPHTNTRSYGIKRWNTTRKKYLFLHPPIPPWSRWSPLSGNICGCKNKSIFNFTIVRIFWPKKPLGGDPYFNLHNFWIKSSTCNEHCPSIVRFESGKKATFWNPPPPSGDLVG